MGKCEVCNQPAGWLSTCHAECYAQWSAEVASGQRPAVSPRVSSRDPLAPSTFRHAAGVITTCLVLVLVLQPLALLVPFLGPLATVFFFLRWWVFPYDAVYPSASLASNGTPTGPPLGHGVSVVQWLVLALLFAALARKAPRISVIGYAIGMIVLVPLATHFLLPVLGLRFYLAGP